MTPKAVLYCIFLALVGIIFGLGLTVWVHVRRRWERQDRQAKALARYKIAHSRVTVPTRRDCNGKLVLSKSMVFGDCVFENVVNVRKRDPDRVNIALVDSSQVAKDDYPHFKLVICKPEESDELDKREDVKIIEEQIQYGGGLARRPYYVRWSLSMLKPTSGFVKQFYGLRDIYVRPCVVVLGERVDEQYGVRHLLLTQRASHMRTFANAWVFPGGHIDPGEEPSVAAEREFREETGIAIKRNTLKCIGVWQAFAPLYMRQFLILIYKCEVKDGWKPLSVDPEEVQAGAWIDAKVAKVLKSTPFELIEEDLIVDSLCVEKRSNRKKKKRKGDTWKKKFFTSKIKPVKVKDMRSKLAAGHRFGIQRWLGETTSKRVSLT